MGILHSLFGTKGPHIVEVSPLGHRFEVPAGKTILEGALDAGIAFPHDCTVGTCGTCKSRLVAGKISALSEFAYTLSAEELAANYILPCQSIARDRLIRLEVSVKSSGLSAPSSLQGRILTATPLTHDILSVELELDRPLRYLAGQYINISAPTLGRARSYSFAVPPAQEGSTRVALCVRKVPGGDFTTALFSGKLSAISLEVHGPHGSFYLRDGAGPIVCLAGGSGLAPIISLLESALLHRVARPAVLLFGARTQQDLYFLDRIDKIRAAWAAPFTFQPVLSHESTVSSWRGARGLVTDFLASSVDGNIWPMSEAYLCGPPGMIDAAIHRLSALGLPPQSLFYDKFTDASHTTLGHEALTLIDQPASAGPVL